MKLGSLAFIAVVALACIIFPNEIGAAFSATIGWIGDTIAGFLTGAMSQE
ncbi:hypothetical protein [Demequina flava]|nr:hypothetical protein [Demequina flava]